MQTFITRTISDLVAPEICAYSAHDLDNQRLGKQRVEAKQIYTALETGKGFIHHPATKMWAGCLPALAFYGFACCCEWEDRGFEDSLREWFWERAIVPSSIGGITGIKFPWWFGDKEMVNTHRSKLLVKNDAHYSKQWAMLDLSDAIRYELPYLWPDAYREGLFMISKAEWNRPGEWDKPPHWFFSEERVVGFE